MRAAFLLLLLFSVRSADAQTAPDDPMAAVTALFEGMRASDSSAVARTLHPEARLMTAALRKDGTPAVMTTPIAAFLTSLAVVPAGALDERLYDVEVRRDGTMAVVWAPYRFYLNGNFSHCGVNQFTLAKVAETWQILHIVDTRRREDCTME